MKKLIAAAVAAALLPLAQADEGAAAHRPLLLAAGSLTHAMNELIDLYAAQGGSRFEARYGPSGKLRKEIEAGREADVFASASVDHTEALAASGLLGPSIEFTHNDLCVVARRELALTEGRLLEVLARPEVRLATSTPVSDPMGDYTWQFFRQAGRQQPGLYEVFDRKALKLSGAAAVPAGVKPPYVTAFEEGRADAYVMYCTNAVATRQALPELSMVHIPAHLNVRSAYGIAAGVGSVEGARFIRFVMQPAGQAVLSKYGFE